MNVKPKHGSFVLLFSALHMHAHVHVLSAVISHLYHVLKLLNILYFHFFSVLVSFMYIAKYWRTTPSLCKSVERR